MINWEEIKSEVITHLFTDYWSLEDVGSKYGVTRERVRQVVTGNWGYTLDKNPAQRRLKGLDSKEFWVEQISLLGNKPSRKELAHKLEITPSTVGLYIHKFKLENLVELSIIERIYLRCENENNHLIWQGCQNNYSPFIMYNGRVKMVRRILWEDMYGPIPDGLRVKRKCQNKLCISIQCLGLTENGKWPRK